MVELIANRPFGESFSSQMKQGPRGNTGCVVMTDGECG